MGAWRSVWVERGGVAVQNVWLAQDKPGRDTVTLCFTPNGCSMLTAHHLSPPSPLGQPPAECRQCAIMWHSVASRNSSSTIATRSVVNAG